MEEDKLSTINYQLSTINYQLSTINYQLIFNEKTTVCFSFEPSFFLGVAELSNELFFYKNY
ncbi:MAG: hypothetical protein DSM107014_11530 [Gomphosphaeria aponina SAG 52.96 = DSM 107014]|uniref:Uncharacterized protein n=1 Tax=Gomphosphaeria aponina SAG 52.96 = DSM 107014 TaxID=1521640 RepID=A0A941GVW3_9CHRO|nr:hypothetical protein [Gomphosphaeria aponina SAG 52.96 = DSM 107014]